MCLFVCDNEQRKEREKPLSTAVPWLVGRECSQPRNSAVVHKTTKKRKKRGEERAQSEGGGEEKQRREDRVIESQTIREKRRDHLS